MGCVGCVVVCCGDGAGSSYCLRHAPGWTAGIQHPPSADTHALSWSPAWLVVTAERPCTDESTRGNAGRRLSAASTRCGGGAAETLIASVLAGGSVTPLV